MSSQRNTVSIHDLPYDMMLEIFTSLSAREIFMTITTCRTLYDTFIQDETVWRMLSAPYGVTDVSVFAGRSFYTIYTRLLHKYGPLIGLWASDLPFSGSVIEFRVSQNRWRPEGSHVIVGDVWRFSRMSGASAHDMDRQDPQLPQYVQFVQIGFDLGVTLDEGNANVVRVIWSVLAGCSFSNASESVSYEQRDERGGYSTPSLHLLSATHQSLYIRVLALQIPHPDFPAPDADTWYDHARQLPRLPIEQVSEVDTDPLSLPPVSLFAEYSTDAPRKPAALSISTPPGVRTLFRLHLHGFFDTRKNSSPRFYPLRDRIERGEDPASSEWRAESLRGLWLGAYGPHGTECLYLEHDGDARLVNAWKVTGDVNVPRGVRSWAMHLDEVTGVHLGEWGFDAGDGPGRAFSGIGFISSHGYVRPESLKVLVVVLGKDEIKVSWEWPNSEASIPNKYIRYRGRDASFMAL
ncbi:hypothetical protein AcW2_005014 [Taiwanofungus camphoratus]|nr:hypothetical protein AcW2_005014 [Antrodia cinnamomea]